MLYLIATDANVVRVAVRAVALSAFAPEDLAVAAEPAARLQVHPRRPLHWDALLVHDIHYQNVKFSKTNRHHKRNQSLVEDNPQHLVNVTHSLNFYSSVRIQKCFQQHKNLTSIFSLHHCYWERKHIKVLRRDTCNSFGGFDKKNQAYMNGAESKCVRREDRRATAHRADWCREAPQSAPHASRPAAITTLGSPPSTANSTYCTFRKRYVKQ